MKILKSGIVRGSAWLLAGLAFVILGMGVYSNQVMKDLKENILRLHVVADSNEPGAQALKLKVRDSVTQYTGEILKDADSAEESYKILQGNIENIQKVAEERARAEGCLLPVTATLGEFEFPVKSYGNISLPTGDYKALRVTIGTGEGENWWCVLFPPLCFVDSEATAVSASGRVQMEENLSSEAFRVIEEEADSGKVNVRFKIVDFFENISRKTWSTWTNTF